MNKRKDFNFQQYLLKTPNYERQTTHLFLGLLTVMNFKISIYA